MRLAGALHLASIAALALAVVVLILGKDAAATVLFVGAGAGFLGTMILRRRR